MKRHKQIEAALLEHPSIHDCVVLERFTDTSDKAMVAYIVPAEPFSPDRLTNHLRSMLSDAVRLPMAFIPVSSIPLSGSGAVNVETLADMVVIDDSLIEKWERHFKSIPEINRVAVVEREYVASSRPLHLSDLLPAREHLQLAGKDSTAGDAEIRSGQATGPSGPAVSAISRGEALQDDGSLPETLSVMLKQAVAKAPDRGIIHVQPDDSEIFQSYPDVLAEAERILAGLRKAGLTPGAMLIFQFERSREFLAAFWGCVLGGYVPVPVSIAPTYKQLNSTVNKLYNAWLMLEKPVIFASSKLAPAIQSLSGLLKCQPFSVIAYDHVCKHEPDSHWHNSKPGDLALLMLTSGSTGMPKGVMLSHSNLIIRSAASIQMNGFNSQEITLNWMPLDHVAGIIYFHLRDVCLGCQQIHAPIESVLEDSLKWLDWIEKYRASITFAPNFAFGLVNDRAGDLGRRSWELSSMKFILNGAEAIVAKTARTFMELLIPHGLSPAAMHPAWGMSETSSGVTYSDRFSLETVNDDDPFVEVGAPIPGFSMRIVDKRDQVIGEGEIGRLQVQGTTVTAGYLKGKEFNREAFTDDGWFITGDLGYLREGRLTITGREKDVIIINSINYYCHEIESVVEQVEGVETSYTAACAIREPSTDTDKLAILFSPSDTDDEKMLEIIREIRTKVVREIGINPDYIIPAEREDIPKTSIGKIQRAQVVTMFASGAFNNTLKQLDILSAGANTLPDWFYRKVWRLREDVTENPNVRNCCSLIFTDERGLGSQLYEELSGRGIPCIKVHGGSGYSRSDSGSYEIDPADPDHYIQLLRSISDTGMSVEQVFHLWTYSKGGDDELNPEKIEAVMEVGIYSLLCLVQAIEKFRDSRTVTMYVVSSCVQPVLPEDSIRYEHSPLLGLTKTVSQEMPWLKCRHIDLSENNEAAAARTVLRESRVLQHDTEVAYRNGQRWVSRLEKVDFRSPDGDNLPFKQGGMYLLSGGLGGVGLVVSKYLLEQFGARLLLAGRTELPDRSAWDSCLDKGNSIADRIRAYRSLEQMGGDIVYEALDVRDISSLQHAVALAESRWNCKLDGVIHLAGAYREKLLADETRNSMREVLSPKITGALALHQLIKDNTHGLFILFSSVASFFGGATVGAYAAANCFLHYFSQYLRRSGAERSYVFSWSTWDDTGLSYQYKMKDLPLQRGYLAMEPGQALNSLLVGLQHNQGNLLIGLDGANRHVRSYVDQDAYQSQRLTAFATGTDGALEAIRENDRKVTDILRTPSSCSVELVPELPLTREGDIDRERLKRERGARFSGKAGTGAPASDLERKIAGLWKNVLSVQRVDIDDNFFELGGDSLLAVRLLSRLNDEFGLTIPIQTLFESPTVKGLAAIVSSTASREMSDSTSEVVMPDTEHPELSQLSDEQVDALLKYMEDEDRKKGDDKS